MKLTKNLGIPLIEGTTLVAKESINDGFEKVDNVVAPKTHVSEKSHFDLWSAKTAYKKQDVFRTTKIPSWGYWEVTKAGTSGTAEPFGSGEGDTVTDGTCELILRRLTTTAAVKSWRLWAGFSEKTLYNEGEVFRTRMTPTWGFWIVTKTGISDNEPTGTTEGTIVTTGTMTCKLVRLMDTSQLCTKKKALTYSLLF